MCPESGLLCHTLLGLDFTEENASTQVGQLTEQYRGLLAADGAGTELEALAKDAREDIAQIEEQLTSIYIDAKASRISEALDECVPLLASISCRCILVSVLRIARPTMRGSDST